MSIKKFVYLTAFTILGVLVSFLVHASLEIPILYFISNNIETVGNGWLWQNWRHVHAYVGIFLWLAGIALGLRLGLHWWPIMYPEKSSSDNA